MRVEWTGNKEIAAMLDTITHQCTMCHGPARVPEDVAAVLKDESGFHAFVICETCVANFIEDQMAP